MGHPAFPFIGQGKAWVIAEEKEERERERAEGLQDRRILILLHVGPVDPVDVNRDGSTSWPCRHRRHAQASPAGHGAPLCPSERRGELTHLSVFVWGLGRTAPICPMLFLM